MPIDVPDQPNGAQLPPQPNDPPTLTDLCNALMYNHRLRLSHRKEPLYHSSFNFSLTCLFRSELELDCMNQNFASSDDVGRGVMYQAKLIQAYAGQDVEAPAWFAPALAACLAPVTRVAHRAYNLSCGDGRSRHFQVLPFVDGTLPTAEPHNLPALTNVDKVNGLTGPQATAYLAGYGLPHQQNIDLRKRAIRSEIGCTAM
ncbi:uncharacterized protein LACBIDRAFT_306810 [Laccaria bicolor S238N-H82]|uniref:Predicted protein n=1 Tax=Laccaria bicolor (strain S238N-H82 / ATCC MYA-4686) TaxID=486041 RepID=B0DNS2_LACBS|nr:uncharacterized protein LACBIDRAFT_306810 [Laccaria bicolor S238N-H82]EDR03703.1 predicted protein [Laccaria bicolor S238N-H82]|eukprot:XP_001885556.1 predicted protein [Laccaria bicolor S238N-H82]